MFVVNGLLRIIGRGEIGEHNDQSLMNSPNINDVTRWKAFCLFLKKKGRIKKAYQPVTLEESVALWLTWQAFPNSQLWNTVSNKLDCLKLELNPDRSCLAFGGEISTSSNTWAGEIIRALCASAVLYFTALCTVVLLQTHTWKERWITEKQSVFLFSLAVEDMAKATVTFRRSLRRYTVFRHSISSALFCLFVTHQFICHYSCLESQKMELQHQETDLAFRRPKDPQQLSWLTTVAYADSWRIPVPCEGDLLQAKDKSPKKKELCSKSNTPHSRFCNDLKITRVNKMLSSGNYIFWLLTSRALCGVFVKAAFYNLKT